MQFLATDDDNGNISDGTPHMAAIYAAFNRHGIACDNPPPVNSGCSSGPTTAPTLTATGGNYNVLLSWNSVPGASQYYVLRTEGIKACDFGKIKLATVSATNYTDTQTLNGRRYYYQVMPVGSNTACLGPLSNCVTAIPSSASPPGKITNSLTLSKSGNNIILNWQSTGVCVINAYAVYRGSLPINLYNHSALNCSVTANSYTDISATGSHYYLVVPNNSAAEGSYGKSFNGSSWQEIPQAETPCKDEQNINDC
jgi:fibronectin type 3 domain-containing protein